MGSVLISKNKYQVIITYLNQYEVSNTKIQASLLQFSSIRGRLFDSIWDSFFFKTISTRSYQVGVTSFIGKFGSYQIFRRSRIETHTDTHPMNEPTNEWEA
jgi:hypothetical protein